MLALASLLFACAEGRAATVSAATGISYQHGIAYLADLSYPADFTHFRYHNPEAPKGGRLRIGDMGNWDTFSEVPMTGRIVAGVNTWVPYRNWLYDRLLSLAIDTTSERYGRLAEGVAVAPDGSWIAFLLREGARWHDGKPITVADYEFTFDVYRNRARPSIRQPMAVFERLEVLNAREFRVWVDPAYRGDPSLPQRLGVLPILPAHYWADRDVTRAGTEPPLGSGPYRVAEFKLGRQIVYERVDDYWGKDIPVNRGRYNFDQIVVDYFRDDQVQYEAVKGDLIDLREETVPPRWATGYDFPAVRAGAFKTELVQTLKPAGMWWPIFWNLRQPRFQDIRVREALWLLRDSAWLNRVGSYNFFGLATSFFHGSELAHRGLPSERELRLLEPFRDQLPPRVFTQEWARKPREGTGWHRADVKRALELLAAAGWVLRDHKLVHERTGEPFKIRFVAVSPALGASFIPYQRVLAKVGIESTIKAPEISSWLHRMRSGDFDAGAIWFLPNNTPILLITNQFHSDSAQMTYGPNWTAIQNPAVDAMIEHARTAQTQADYIAAIRALDRVLMWNFYFVPSSSRTHKAMAYWDRFGRASYGLLEREAFYDAWWWDAEKAARVERIRASNAEESATAVGAQ